FPSELRISQCAVEVVRRYRSKSLAQTHSAFVPRLFGRQSAVTGTRLAISRLSVPYLQQLDSAPLAVSFASFCGADRIMTAALVFPGQGSQAVGMGRALAEAFAPARNVFEEVDAALGERLSTTIWNGPGETLTLTENAQPALMAVSLAVLRVLESEI